MRFVKNTVEPHDTHSVNCVTLYFQGGVTPGIITKAVEAVKMSSKVRCNTKSPDYQAKCTGRDGLTRIQVFPNL